MAAAAAVANPASSGSTGATGLAGVGRHPRPTPARCGANTAAPDPPWPCGAKTLFLWLTRLATTFNAIPEQHKD